MTTVESPADQPGSSVGETRWRRRARRALSWTALVVAIYLLIAYIVLPVLWRHYDHQPSLADAPKTTETKLRMPGDPLNVGFVGSESELIGALVAAKWHPADPITIRSSLKIAGSVVFDRSYLDAPVSSLYLFGRRQDLAFEFPAGKSAKRRQHVRIWRYEKLDVEGRPFWIGAATFDDGVGMSHYTGQITHHISPDVDAERDRLMADLEKTGDLATLYQVTGVGATVNGRNGGGDWYYTDGELTVGVLRKPDAPQVKTVARLPNPPAVRLKNEVYRWIRGLAIW